MKEGEVHFLIPNSLDLCLELGSTDYILRRESSHNGCWVINGEVSVSGLPTIKVFCGNEHFPVNVNGLEIVPQVLCCATVSTLHDC